MSTGRVYHWKHGWIALDHVDAGSPDAGIRSRRDVAKATMALPDVPAAHRVSALAQLRGAAEQHGASDLLPGHSWQPIRVQHDGSPAGIAAAAKVRQAFKMGNKQVHIETNLTPEQTQGLLDDVRHVTSQAGSSASHPVTFRVPHGDHVFDESPEGVNGGYVDHGDSTTVHINPAVASGEFSAQHVHGGMSSQFMPGSEATGMRRWVIAHELGHTVDHRRSQTESRDATKLHRSHQSSLSTYGNESPGEGYAEVYAEWLHGGHSAIVRDYARRYGWTR